MKLRSQESTKVIEWICGIDSMPIGTSDANGKPRRSESLAWLLPGDDVRLTPMLDPDEALNRIVNLCQQLMQSPSVGPSRQPTHIRIACKALAEKLRAGLDANIQVICAATPELDWLLSTPRELIKDCSASEPSYFEGNADSETLARFFGAVAALVQADPCSSRLLDEGIQVNLELQQVASPVVLLARQSVSPFRCLLFSTYADFATYTEVTRLYKIHEIATLDYPPYIELNFWHKDDLPESMGGEVEKFGWLIENENSYPEVLFVDSDAYVRALSSDELHTVSSVLRALAEFIKDSRAAAPDRPDLCHGGARSGWQPTEYHPISARCREQPH
jgi:hypothetical protein